MLRGVHEAERLENLGFVERVLDIEMGVSVEARDEILVDPKEPALKPAAAKKAGTKPA